MNVIVHTYERLEQKIIELVQDGYKQTDITDRAIIFSKWKCGMKCEIKLIPSFWDINKALAYK